MVAKLLEIDSGDLYRNLLKPKIKVGNEFVTQGRTKEQVYFSMGGLCKAMFDKLFKWLVNRCNRTLSTKSKKAFFIGVLDIAGFEIFQVCITVNYM
jgi:myosin heavy chain 6/7